MEQEQRNSQREQDDMPMECVAELVEEEAPAQEMELIRKRTGQDGRNVIQATFLLKWLVEEEEAHLPVQEIGDVPSHPYNDMGNARRVLDGFQETARFCTDEGRWYHFDGTVWKPDTSNLVGKQAVELLYAAYSAELEQKQQEQGYEAQREALRLAKRREAAGNWRTVQGCLKIAETEAAIPAEQFDREPHWFHFQNGMLNLKTLEILFFHKKERHFTKTAGAGLNLDPATEAYSMDCPCWQQFVQECAMGDMDLYRYLQKAAAYSILSGDISEQKVFCLLGEGRNGKSLFINTLAEVAGDYACKLDSAVLTTNRHGERDNDVSKELYRIRGSRFVYSNEFSSSSTLNEVLIKTITDGGKISCRPLYAASIEYVPTYTLWFSTNHMPNLVAMDAGVRRRIVVIPFQRHLTEAQIDRSLPEKLRAEANEILMWLLQGYVGYLGEGLTPPPAVREATARYFDEQNLYQQFLSQHYVADDAGKVYTREVYQVYRQWCAENGEKPVSSRMLNKELKRLGIVHQKDRVSTYYCLKACQNENGQL